MKSFSDLKKFIKYIPLFSAAISILFSLLFSFILIKVGFQVNQNFYTVVFYALTFNLTILVIELISKRFKSATNITSLLIFWFLAWTFIIGYDSLNNTAANIDLDYISFDKSQESPILENFDIKNDKSLQINSRNTHGNFTLNISDESNSLSGKYFFEDENPKFEIVGNNTSTIINLFNDFRQFNFYRLFSRSNDPEIRLDIDPTKQNIDINSICDGDSCRVKYNSGIIINSNLIFKNSLCEFSSGENLEQGKSSVIFIENSNCKLSNINYFEKQDLNVFDSEVEILLSQYEYENQEITINAERSTINIILLEDTDFSIDYEKIQDLEIDNREIDQSSGTYTSENYSSSEFPINLKITGDSSKVIISN